MVSFVLLSLGSLASATAAGGSSFIPPLPNAASFDLHVRPDAAANETGLKSVLLDSGVTTIMKARGELACPLQNAGQTVALAVTLGGGGGGRRRRWAQVSASMAASRPLSCLYRNAAMMSIAPKAALLGPVTVLQCLTAGRFSAPRSPLTFMAHPSPSSTLKRIVNHPRRPAWNVHARADACATILAAASLGSTMPPLHANRALQLRLTRLPSLTTT